MNLSEMLHDGSPWLLLACCMFFVGVVIGLFTERGSGISSHPYTKAASGGALASDLPAEALGRAELEPVLWGHRGADGKHHRTRPVTRNSRANPSERAIFSTSRA